jgi:phospholipid/cholesterol/gamma-HCH transport system permease protein
VNPVAAIAEWSVRQIEGVGAMVMMAIESLVWLFRRPFRWRVFLQAFEFVGAGSLFIVILTGAFTGMVMAVQTMYAFRLFNAESLVGTTVALALTRELGPVLTGLMVTGRVGSSIATEIGTMEVTEQIDALRTMAVNPVQYLVTPRVVAATLMLPLLTQLCNVVGIAGAWLVAVKGMGLDEGIFFDRIINAVSPWDMWSGIIKAAVFGFAIAVVSCYKGYSAQGGARGVGMATTQAVVVSSVTILVLDYFLTVLMF